uniref:syntaxin-18 n=1 Tax=Myxine glutinosa TaxID=7769 RepID=UPI00358E2971
MAADITSLFRASVRAVRSRNKAQGQLLDAASTGVDRHESEKESLSLSQRIMPKGRDRGDLSTRAKELVTNVTKLREFILEHRRDYLSTGRRFLIEENERMTDVERDQMDQSAEEVMRACSDMLKQLGTDVSREVVPTQVKQHQEGMLDLIRTYLKEVCNLYAEQRAIRVKRMVDRKQLLRLDLDVKHNKRAVFEGLASTKGTEIPGPSEPERGLADDIAQSKPLWDKGATEEEISPEELQMFEEENQRIFNEMNSLMTEVRQIEGKVVEISKLQEIFTEKVLEQEKTIEGVHGLVVGSTENIKEGNEEIREAMKNNAGFRVWILFFLAMCSFSLLFLDWYG